MGLLSNLINPIITTLDPYITDLTDFLSSPRTLRIFIKTLFAILVSFSLLLIAFLAYGVFYYAYVPTIAHTAPVHLIFDRDIVPTAIVDMAKTNERFLEPGQEYDVSVDLVMPTSGINLEQGNFMVRVELVDGRGALVVASGRPAILCYRSWFVRTLSVGLRSVFLMFDFDEESQKISKTVIENYVESANKPVTKAIVSISSKSLQIYSATIRFDAHFKGLRYLMYYYSVSTAVVFILSFLFWETLFSLVGWKLFVNWWETKGQLDRYPDEYGREMITSDDLGTSRSADVSSSGEASWTELAPRGNLTELLDDNNNNNDDDDDDDDSEPRFDDIPASVASSSSPVRNRTRTKSEEQVE